MKVPHRAYMSTRVLGDNVCSTKQAILKWGAKIIVGDMVSICITLVDREARYSRDLHSYHRQDGDHIESCWDMLEMCTYR